MRFSYVLLLISSLGIANTSQHIALMRSYVENLRHPKTDDLFAICESFLAPFPSTENRSLSESDLKYIQARERFLAGDWADTEKILKKLSPTLQIEYILGAVNAKNGRLKEAKQHFRNSLTFKPDLGSDQAIRELSLKALALLAEYEGNYEQSLSFLDQLSQTDLRYETDRAILEQQKSNFQTLKQILIQALLDLQIQLEKQKHPELEIPLSNFKQVQITLDSTTVYSSSHIKPNSLISFPVDFGLHRLSINQLAYWLWVTLDSNFEIQFTLMDAQFKAPEQPAGSSLKDLEDRLKKAAWFQRQLELLQGPVFALAKPTPPKHLLNALIQAQIELQKAQALELQEKKQ